MRWLAALLLALALAGPGAAQDTQPGRGPAAAERAAPPAVQNGAPANGEGGHRPSPPLPPVTLDAGYEDRAARGPATAQGVVIWLHGTNADRAESRGPAPFAMDALADAGFDVFRLQRPPANDNLTSGTTALIRAIADLRGQGYRRVILAGQSAGAWISLNVMTQRDVNVDGIIAFAPARFGERGRSQNWERNASWLYMMAREMRPARVLLFLFENDNFDPGGRGPELARIFAERQVSAAIVDRPPGIIGHAAGVTFVFARRYGECLVSFARRDDLTGFACNANEPRTLAGIPVPALTVVRDGVPAERARFLGTWHGAYVVGREFALVVHTVTGDRVEAVYAWSQRGRFPDDRAGSSRRVGTIDAASQTLEFNEPNMARLTFRLQPDGRLATTWVATNGTQTLVTTARRAD